MQLSLQGKWIQKILGVGGGGGPKLAVAHVVTELRTGKCGQVPHAVAPIDQDGRSIGFGYFWLFFGDLLAIF